MDGRISAVGLSAATRVRSGTGAHAMHDRDRALNPANAASQAQVSKARESAAKALRLHVQFLEARGPMSWRERPLGLTIPPSLLERADHVIE